MRQPVGVVLAGGAGRRLGGPKGPLRVRGERLASRAAAALGPACRRVVVSIAPGAENPAPGFPAIEDVPPGGRGPLAGIAAGFGEYPGEHLLVLACDYPEVGTPLLETLLVCAEAGDEEVVLPRNRSGRHPLVALWRAGAAGAVTAALAAGEFRVGAVLERLQVRDCAAAAFPGVDLERALINVNRPADLDLLRNGD